MKNDIVKRPIIAPGRTINDVQPAPTIAIQATALPSMTPQQQSSQDQSVEERLPNEGAQTHIEAQLQTEEQHEEHHQTHTPVGAIFLATVVFLILAAAAVYSQLQASGSGL